MKTDVMGANLFAAVLFAAAMAATASCDSVSTMDDCGPVLLVPAGGPGELNKYPTEDEVLEGHSVFTESGFVAVTGNDRGNLYAVTSECEVYKLQESSWEAIDLGGAPADDSSVRCLDAFTPGELNGVWTVGTMESGPIPSSFASLLFSPVKDGIPERSSSFFFIAQSDPRHPCLDSYVEETAQHQHGAWLESVNELEDGSVLVLGGWSLGDEQPDPDYSTPTWPDDMLRKKDTRGLVNICEYVEGGENFSCEGLEYPPDVPFSDGYGASRYDFYVVGNSFLVGDGDISVTGEVHRCNRCECVLEHSVKGCFLKAVWGSSMDDVYVVGGHGSPEGGQQQSVLLHKDAQGWSEVELDSTIPLNDVRGTSSSNVFVVGGHSPDTGSPQNLALRYDGSDWSTLDTGTTSPIYGVFPRSDHNTWLATSDGLVQYPE